MSSLLDRPILISENHAAPPNLRLENPTASPDFPSPFTHVKLQYDLICAYIKKFGSISDHSTPQTVFEICDLIETWMANLPAPYALENPDTQYDAEYRYVLMQRRHTHAVGYSSLLTPLKPYLTKAMTAASPEAERKLRAKGVEVALALMNAGNSLFNFVFPVRAKYHFVVFCIFDTAALLCAAILHDGPGKDGKRGTYPLPQREKVIEAIASAVDMLEQLNNHTKTGAMSYRIITKLIGALPVSEAEKRILQRNGGVSSSNKRNKNSATTATMTTTSSSSAVAAATVYPTDDDLNAMANSTSNSTSSPDAPSIQSNGSVNSSEDTQETSYSWDSDTFKQHQNIALDTYGGIPTTNELGYPTVVPMTSLPMPTTTLPSSGFTDGWQFPDINAGAEQQDVFGTFGEMNAVDLGELEQIWDWQSLNLGWGGETR
jgi:hypothetical protein